MTIMKITRLPSVCKWMGLTQDGVLDKFYGLPNAFSDGKKQERFVYVPGTRDDRVILIAHADTVFRGQRVVLDFHDDIVFSKQRMVEAEIRGGKNGSSMKRWGIGIGADDRAGCAILWELRNLGHSLLITSGEEIGCVSSRRIMNNETYWQPEIASHNFAVQFDRRGNSDIVFYNVGTKAFVKYVQAETNFKPQSGTMTDIRVLCKDICGVNMSVGYYNEHSPDERLVLSQWQNTLTTASDWLKKPNLPKFPLNKNDIYDHDDVEFERKQEQRQAEEKARRLRNPEYYEYEKRHSGTSNILGPVKVTNFLSGNDQKTSNPSVSKISKITKVRKSPNKVWLATKDGIVENTVVEPKITSELAKTVLSSKHVVKCPNCSAKMKDAEWFNNDCKCTSCNKKF